MGWRRPLWFDERDPPLWRRLLLAPLSFCSLIYATVTALRRAAYSHGFLRAARLECRVISVGNLAVGGAGKTPICAALATAFRKQGVPTAIISRGYGRSGENETILVSGRGAPTGPARVDADRARQMGDEPVWLGSRAGGVPIWVSAKRARAGRYSMTHFGTERLILDDAFQHLALSRDIDLVAVDGVGGFGNGWVLPRGPLREGPDALRFADALVIVDPPLHPDDEALLDTWCPATPRFVARRRAISLQRFGSGEALPLSRVRGASLGMLCAIAQPASMRRTLMGLGATIESEALFPDHHRYEKGDIEALPRRVAPWVTSEKDATKLRAEWFRDREVWVLAIDMAIDEEAAFFTWVETALRKR